MSVGQVDVADVDLVGDQVDEVAQTLGIGRGDGDRLEGQPDTALMCLADRQRRRADVAYEIHGLDEVVERRQLVDGRPVGEMHAVRGSRRPCVIPR